jgi:N-acyl amino acid synthase of PEP-CTERM/exosortase system
VAIKAMSNLAEHFSEYFSLQFANTELLQQETFKIRHQVYCRELNYQMPENCPEGLEKDKDDDRSLHFLLQHKPSNSFAGCVRLVLPSPQSAQLMLPFERALSGEKVEIDWNPRLREKYAEMSRLAVLGRFRRRQGEKSSAMGELPSLEAFRDRDEAGERKFPVIALSLYLIPIVVALELDIEIVVTMKPRLARHLRSIGVVSHCLSSFFDYYGKQGVFRINPREIFATEDPNLRDLIAVIRRGSIESLTLAKCQQLRTELKSIELLQAG